MIVTLKMCPSCRRWARWNEAVGEWTFWHDPPIPAKYDGATCELDLCTFCLPLAAYAAKARAQSVRPEVEELPPR